jgi:predicted RNase H-like nuclease (RuvC/YqgF family)
LPIADVLLPGAIDENREENEIMEQQLELLTKQLQNEREEHKRNYDFMQARIESLKKTIEEKDRVIEELLKK